MNDEFRRFQRTGVDVDNIGLAISNPDLYGIPGRVYCLKFWAARSNDRVNYQLSSIYGGSDYDFSNDKQWVCFVSNRYIETDDIQEVEEKLFARSASTNTLSKVKELYGCQPRLMYSISRIREWILSNGTRFQLAAMADSMRNGSVRGGTSYVSDGPRLECGSAPLGYEETFEHAQRRHDFHKIGEAAWK